MNQAVDVIVIGGGIIGLAAAFHLTRRGQKVLLLGKKYPGSGSTGRYFSEIILDNRYPFDWSEFSMGRDFSRQELLK
jgi:glycine/D-amino acid oxidase-like deaminating enzyme